MTFWEYCNLNRYAAKRYAEKYLEKPTKEEQVKNMTAFNVSHERAGLNVYDVTYLNLMARYLHFENQDIENLMSYLTTPQKSMTNKKIQKACLRVIEKYPDKNLWCESKEVYDTLPPEEKRFKNIYHTLSEVKKHGQGIVLSRIANEEKFKSAERKLP